MSDLRLAIDTSAPEGSVALGDGARVVADRTFQTREGHSASLLPEVDRLLTDAGASPADLGAIVITGGPGSFTGLRVAAATAKGLVHGGRAEMFAYSTLLSLAAATEWGQRVCALLDARRDEVFVGAYRIADGRVDTLLAPRVIAIGALVESLDEDVRFTGPGAVRHAALLERSRGEDAITGPVRSTAAALFDLARDLPALGRVEIPADWEPDYLRASGAERMRIGDGTG